MDARSNGVQSKKSRLRVWFVRVCSSIVLYTCIVQLVAVGELWHPRLLSTLSNRITTITYFSILHPDQSIPLPASPPPPPPPPRIYKSHGYLKVSCNGGLNQMRAAICDMVAIARLLNLTLVVPELDKTSFWSDPSNFGDIFDVRHFLDSLRDEVKIIKRLPKRNRRVAAQVHVMAPVSWSNETYYLEQILPLFNKYNVIHFNKTDARLANNGLSLDLQKLRCRVNYQALKFAPHIEALGNKLVQILKKRGSFVALHLRYEMDMLAFSGCTHGCMDKEAEQLKLMSFLGSDVKDENLRNECMILISIQITDWKSEDLSDFMVPIVYAYPWWREKEIISEEKRLQGLCPLTPEEAALVLQALGFQEDTQIYIASGEIYGSNRRLAALRAAFPGIVKKEMLLDPGDLQQFQNHSSQMAALDFMVSVASDVFIPTYDGNMAKLVEGHRRYLGFRKTITLDRKLLVRLLDLHQNKTLSWEDFSAAVQLAHVKKVVHPGRRTFILEKPKEEEYFYANPHECICNGTICDVPWPNNSRQPGVAKFQ
ncbi:hypothetical protein Sjap_023924 [Stephania japonica]|uniref:O-fucosyltransferase family protein n=1 Tax=Stephania japonica TaxID=461633 RepID=A0AAP0HN85_9MAGN